MHMLQNIDLNEIICCICILMTTCTDYISGERDTKCGRSLYQGNGAADGLKPLLWVDNPTYNNINKKYARQLDPNITFGKPDPKKYIGDQYETCPPSIEYFSKSQNDIRTSSTNGLYILLYGFIIANVIATFAKLNTKEIYCIALCPLLAYVIVLCSHIIFDYDVVYGALTFFVLLQLMTYWTFNGDVQKSMMVAVLMYITMTGFLI